MKAKARQPTDDSFTAFVIDQLRGLGAVEARAMFGGKGLYWKDQIFGLIDQGRLYFRASDASAERYRAQGSKPFEPWPGHVMKGYYEVPANIVEDEDASVAWAREAWSLPRANRGEKTTADSTRRRTPKASVRRAK